MKVKIRQQKSKMATMRQRNKSHVLWSFFADFDPILAKFSLPTLLLWPLGVERVKIRQKKDKGAWHLGRHL
jgi:hypothetical protein